MPRLVHIVFSASAVTMIMQRPVPGHAGAGGGTAKSTPAAWMSSAKTAPRSSSRTLPTKPAAVPSEPGRWRCWPPSPPTRSSSTESGVDRLGPGVVDEGHRALRQPEARHQLVVGSAASTSTMAWPTVTMSTARSSRDPVVAAGGRS